MVLRTSHVVTLPRFDVAVIKRLQTPAPAPTHEISHKDHLVPRIFHRELIIQTDILINNHTASLNLSDSISCTKYLFVMDNSEQV